MKQLESKTTDLAEYGNYAGAGFEDIGVTDLAIPYITLLQPMSGLISRGIVKRECAGNFYNSVTKEVYKGDTGIVFQPVHLKALFVEWNDNTRKIVSQHEANSEYVINVIENYRKKMMDNGIRNPFTGKIQVTSEKEKESITMVETRYVYGNILNDSGTDILGSCIIPFSLSKLRICKDWFTAMYTLKGKPPLFANRCVIKTFSTPKNNSVYYNYQIEPLKGTWLESLIDINKEEHLLTAAVNFRNGILSKDKLYSLEPSESGEDCDEIPF